MNGRVGRSCGFESLSGCTELHFFVQASTDMPAVRTWVWRQLLRLTTRYRLVCKLCISPLNLYRYTVCRPMPTRNHTVKLGGAFLKLALAKADSISIWLNPHLPGLISAPLIHLNVFPLLTFILFLY